MTRIRVTGSKAHRVWKCPPSIVLPQVETDSRSPAAERGTAIHRFLERVKIVGLELALAEAPEDLRSLLSCLDLTELPVHLATEVSLVYDYRARTAREIGRNLGRDYEGHLARTGQRPIGPTEIALTIDLMGGETAHGIRRGYVGDYKSGHSRYPAPDMFGQTLLAALAVRHVYECTEVIVELIHIRDDGDHFRVRRKVDEWDLDTFADELAAAFDLVTLSELELAAGRAVPVREGDHCNYCDAFKSCPAKIALVRAMPTELDIPPGEITRARAAEAWMVLDRYSDLIARVRQEITALAAFDPIDLPDGRVIGPVITEREKLDGPIAADVLRQWYGDEAAAEAIKISMSKEALQDAVAKRRKEGEVIQSKKGTGILDQIMKEIRARKGTEYTRTESIKPYTPRKKLTTKSGEP